MRYRYIEGNYPLQTSWFSPSCYTERILRRRCRSRCFPGFHERFNRIQAWVITDITEKIFSGMDADVMACIMLLHRLNKKTTQQTSTSTMKQQWGHPQASKSPNFKKVSRSVDKTAFPASVFPFNRSRTLPLTVQRFGSPSKCNCVLIYPCLSFQTRSQTNRLFVAGFEP